ncbi:MAG TPA: replication-associated recombination protein A [bacterium]|nr:replication-associated recombination protein A [bacterium]
MSLFPEVPAGGGPPSKDAPLADRMRPRTLDEVVGQQEVLGPSSAVRVAVEEKKVPSMILWGPPGVGKTTIARLLAHDAGYRFVSYSAVTSGIKEIRECVEEARRARTRGERTLVFVDEIHRFNKAQQDALLPHVEDGLLTLVGATTENPSFEVNAALLSRCRVAALTAISDEDLRTMLRRAVNDHERGLPADITVDDSAIEAIVSVAGGDGRRSLNLLEAAATLARGAAKKGNTAARVTGDDVRKLATSSALLYDRAGDEHYNLASALIKSLRGSDPDASIYWMARMLEAGEDPLFVARRLVIFAAEDVGLADPRALQVAVSAKDAAHFTGMPEAKLALSMACLYLATAPKSNSALASYSAAAADVHAHGALPTPLAIRNAPTKMMKEMGYGKDYQYPHDTGGLADQEYLPELLAKRGARYYDPIPNGYEKTIDERLKAWDAERAKRRADAPKGRTE